MNFTALNLFYFNGLLLVLLTERFNGNGGRCKQRNLRSVTNSFVQLTLRSSEQYLLSTVTVSVA